MKHIPLSSLRVAVAALASLALSAACADTGKGRVQHKANGPAVFSGFQLTGTPEAGMPLGVIINYSVPQGPPVTVRYVAGTGLQLSQIPSDTALPGTGQQTQTVTVIPLGQGTAYLDLFIERGSRTAVHSLPIRVGQPTVPSVAGKLKTGPDGESLLTVPVR